MSFFRLDILLSVGEAAMSALSGYCQSSDSRHCYGRYSLKGRDIAVVMETDGLISRTRICVPRILLSVKHLIRSDIICTVITFGLSTRCRNIKAYNVLKVAYFSVII